ncbi:mitochondrial iron uptake protein, partial [Histoplasma capsulatum]
MLPRTSRATSSLLRTPAATIALTPLSAIVASVTPRTQLRSSNSRRLQHESPARAYYRQLHTTPSLRKGITPHSSNPTPPNPESSNSNIAGGANHVTQPTPLTEEQYREYVEDYFNVLLTKVEQMQENGSDVEAEYSVCIYTKTYIYVIRCILGSNIAYKLSIYHSYAMSSLSLLLFSPWTVPIT